MSSGAARNPIPSPLPTCGGKVMLHPMFYPLVLKVVAVMVGDCAWSVSSRPRACWSPVGTTQLYKVERLCTNKLLAPMSTKRPECRRKSLLLRRLISAIWVSDWRERVLSTPTLTRHPRGHPQQLWRDIFEGAKIHILMGPLGFYRTFASGKSINGQCLCWP